MSSLKCNVICLQSRLQYFALGIQGYIRKLREFLAGKSTIELNMKENKLKSTALKSATNINSLIKDLFHSPPSYKTKIVVSWRPQSGEKDGAFKRKPISFDDGPAAKRTTKPTPAATNPRPRAKPTGNKGVYKPPINKYSSGLGNLRGEERPSRGGRGTPRGARGRGRVY